MIRLIGILTLVPCLCFGQGPYAPPAGQMGSTAISKDSSIFVAWANSCTLHRGYYDIADKDSTVTHGSASDATGKADGSVVSLGDSGLATLTFPEPIHNGPGADFAVFENALNDDFLELAFVEVSSDGNHFVRFPAVSLTPANVQTGPFGPTDATDLYNLGGKYRGGFGTPFDLEELQDSSINVNSITHVRIVDVIGTIDSALGSYDSQGNLVNDPYPTLFPSGGFDLDAVGVIHSGEIGLEEREVQVEVYPNPAADFIIVERLEPVHKLEIIELSGKSLLEQDVSQKQGIKIDVRSFKRGVYLLRLKSPEGEFIQKIILE